MPEGIGSIRPTLIPSLTEVADIQTAFRLYHYGSTSVPASIAAASNTSMVGIIRDIFNGPTITNPSVTGGTFIGPTLQNPSSTGGTFVSPTLQNPSVTSGTFISPTISTPSVTGSITITSQPVLTSTSATSVVLFSSTVTDIAIGSSTIKTTAYPSAGTTSTATSSAGYMGMPQNSTTTGAYRLVAADAGTHIYSTATRTITIPGSTTGGTPQVNFPIGTTIIFINASGTTVTLQMDGTSTDTCLLAGVGTSMTGGSGSRTLAAFGFATLVKITATSWIVSGNGLT